MLGFNKYGSYGWVLFENLKGMVESLQSDNLEMRGYYRGCIAMLTGEIVANKMKADNIEFSTEIYEKQVDRVRRLVDNLLQQKKQ